MKRLLTIFMLLLSLLVLTGCELLGGEQFKEVEMTQEELQSALDDIDFSKVTDDVIAFTSRIDIELELASKDAMFGEGEQSLSIELHGKADLYANLKSFEEMMVFLDVDISFKIQGGEFIDLPDLEGFVKGKAYITSGNAYLELSYKLEGVEVTVKNKILDVISAEDFSELKPGLEGLNELISFDDILEELPYKVYKSKDRFKLEVVPPSLDDLVDMLTEELSEVLDVEVTENKPFKLELLVLFSKQIEKISLDTELDFEVMLTAKEPGVDSFVSLSVAAEANITLDFHGKMPKVPSLTELNAYPTGLPNIPFFN